MIAFNAVTQLLSLGGILLLQAVYMILVARVLGPEDFGRFSFAWSIIHVMLIGGALGLNNTALRKISADRERSAEISQTFFWLRSVLVLAQFAIILTVAYFIHENPETRVMLAIFGVGFAIHSICFSMNVVFQAHGKLYLASINAFVVFGGHAIIGLIILSLGGHLIALSTAYLGASIIGLALNLKLFPNNVHAFRIRRQNDWREYVRQSIPVGLGTLFQSVMGRSAIALLLFLSGPLETGIYSAASRIPFVLRNIPSAFLAAVIPVMAAHQEKPATVHRLFKKSFVIMMVMAVPLSIGFHIFARPLILLLYGEQYEASIDNLRILSWAILPIFAGMAFGHVLLSQDHLVKKVPWVTGIGLTVVLVACLTLIPGLGDKGAAYSVLIAHIVVAGGYFLAARKFLFYRPDKQ
jgi:O-antigen/teichoic acid export membrane protein